MPPPEHQEVESLSLNIVSNQFCIYPKCLSPYPLNCKRARRKFRKQKRVLFRRCLNIIKDYSTWYLREARSFGQLVALAIRTF